jgi:hypothetical protein
MLLLSCLSWVVVPSLHAAQQVSPVQGNQILPTVRRLVVVEGCIDRDRIEITWAQFIKVTERHYAPWVKARQAN